MAEEQATNYAATVRLCLQAEARRIETQALGSGARRRIIRLASYFVRQLLRLSGWCIDTALSSVRTATSLSKVLPLCDPRKVVSLDVFDTLLCRTVEPPDFLKRRSASYAAHRLSRRGFPISRDLFLYLRAAAESRLR